jgi:hypothetical protein
VRSFAEPETNADPDMADGEPDGLTCGDTLRAWAPPASPNQAILTLTYAAPLLLAQVNIVQSGNPGGILRVEVLDSASGLGQLIYEGGRPAKGICPEILSLPVATGFVVDTVIVTVAASDTPTQIDAVELLGSLPAFVDSPVFWRVSIPSEDPPQGSGLPGGIAADSLGNIYVAEGTHGIYSYDVEGNQLHFIPSPSHSNLTDVSTDVFGNLVVTDCGYGWFIVLSPSGEQIVAGGEDFANDGPLPWPSAPQMAICIYVTRRASAFTPATWPNSCATCRSKRAHIMGLPLTQPGTCTLPSSTAPVCSSSTHSTAKFWILWGCLPW